jgi:5,10-methylene-tetrahydrofolate dehydrogenase/methenyl tetrahydrofolate cyclohydrolase
VADNLIDRRAIAARIRAAIGGVGPMTIADGALRESAA